MKPFGIILLTVTMAFMAILFSQPSAGFWRGSPIPVHESITIEALRAIRQDLGNYNTALFNYDAMSEIALYNNKADDDQTYHHHFDNDSFTKASDRLIKLRGDAINALIDDAFLRDTAFGKNRRDSLVKKSHYYMGEALHTLQDFFSHSNWVEQQELLSASLRQRTKEQLFRTFGKGYIRGANSGQGCDLQEPEFSVLTTGWVYDPQKPLLSGTYSLANCYRPENKCPHGNFAACPEISPPTNGLNKDTPAVSTDEERAWHYRARAAAIEATAFFVSDFLADVMDAAKNDPGLRERLGSQGAVESGRVAVCSFMGDIDPFYCASPLPLVIEKEGQGKGSVYSQDGLICGPGCSDGKGFFTPGEVAELTAEPDENSVFVKWSGDTNCTTESYCDVTIDKERKVTAEFSSERTVTVIKIESETGLATSSGYVYSSLAEGIDCGPVCKYGFPQGTSINLWAENGGGLTFVKWADDSDVCAGQSGNCFFSVDANKSAKAIFNKLAIPDRFSGTLSGAYYFQTIDPGLTQNCFYSFNLAGPVSITGLSSGNPVFQRAILPNDPETWESNCYEQRESSAAIRSQSIVLDGTTLFSETSFVVESESQVYRVTERFSGRFSEDFSQLNLGYSRRLEGISGVPVDERLDVSGVLFPSE